MTRRAAEPIASLSGVCHSFGQRTALEHIDFTLDPGRVVALLGPNGAGKTTLVKILLGLIRPSRGTVRVWGHEPTAPAARQRVGAMLQVGRVPETLTVAEHVRLFSSYYGTPAPLEHTLHTAGVLDLRNRLFGELSGGQRQRVLFALAICGRPDILILDEPTVGLDVDARRAFWASVRTIVEGGCAVLLTTHYLEEADAVADRVAILQRGRIVRDAAPAVIKRQVGGKNIRCRTTLPVAALSGMYGVRWVRMDGESVVFLAEQPERVVRELLARDAGLSDLEVTGAGLEEAFLTLTGEGETHVGIACA